MKKQSALLIEIKVQLKKILKANGYSYKDVANKTGLSYIKVRRIMTVQEIKLNELLLILEILNFDLNEKLKEMKVDQDKVMSNK